MRSSRPMGAGLAATAALMLAAAGHPAHVVPADTRPLPPAPTMRRSNDLRVRISRQLAAEIEAHNREVEWRKAEKRRRRQMRDRYGSDITSEQFEAALIAVNDPAARRTTTTTKGTP